MAGFFVFGCATLSHRDAMGGEMSYADFLGLGRSINNTQKYVRSNTVNEVLVDTVAEAYHSENLAVAVAGDYAIKWKVVCRGLASTTRVVANIKLDAVVTHDWGGDTERFQPPGESDSENRYAVVIDGGIVSLDTAAHDFVLELNVLNAAQGVEIFHTELILERAKNG